MYQTEIHRVKAFIIASKFMHMHCNSNMGTSAKSLHIMLVTEIGTTEIQMHKTIKQARHNRGICTATATWAPQQRVCTSCWSQKQAQQRFKRTKQSSKQGITKIHALQHQTWAPQPRVCTSCWSQSHRNRQNIGRQHPAPTGNSNQGN